MIYYIYNGYIDLFVLFLDVVLGFFFNITKIVTIFKNILDPQTRKICSCFVYFESVV